jgi:type III secretion protein T
MNPLDEWLQAALRNVIGSYESVLPAYKVLMLVALVSLRYGIVVMIVPVFMASIMTGTVRGGFVIGMAVFTAIGTPLHLVNEINGIEWVLFAAREVALGAALGFALAVPFWAAEGVGAAIDMQVGYNNVQHTNPLSDQEATPIGQLLMHTLMVVFIAAGGLTMVVGTVIASFQVWPVTSGLPSMEKLALHFLPRNVDSLMTAVVKFSSAVLLVLVLIDIGVGFVARSADKLETNELGKPVKAAVALLIIALLLGTFMTQLMAYVVPSGIIDLLKSTL